MRYLSLIESFYPSFSKQEKKIADFIFKKKELVCIMSLTEITKTIAVSEATIVRFVRKLGFKGFSDFKLEIAKEEPLLKNEVCEDYIDNISHNIAETINNTKKLLDKKTIDKVIELINKAEKMYIFGIGASGVAALEMQNRFMRFGKISHSVNDGHFQVMYSSLMTKKDILIVLSLSGETADLVYPVNIANERKAKVIVITHYIQSTLAKMADIVILTSAKETPLDGGSLIAKISQLYIIDVLATGYALKNENIAKETRNNIARAISNKNRE